MEYNILCTAFGMNIRSTLQCDQIWPNFATLTSICKSLAIFNGLFCIWQNFKTKLAKILCYWANIVKQLSNLVTLQP